MALKYFSKDVKGMFGGLIPAVSLNKFQYCLAFLNLAFSKRSVFFLSKLYLAFRMAVLYSILL